MSWTGGASTAMAGLAVRVRVGTLAVEFSHQATAPIKEAAAQETITFRFGFIVVGIEMLFNELQSVGSVDGGIVTGYFQIVGPGVQLAADREIQICGIICLSDYRTVAGE